MFRAWAQTWIQVQNPSGTRAQTRVHVQTRSGTAKRARQTSAVSFRNQAGEQSSNSITEEDDRRAEGDKKQLREEKNKKNLIVKLPMKS